MSKARIAPVLTRGLVDLLVLPEHHAPSKRGLGGRQSRAHGALRATSHRIEDAGDTAPAAPREGRAIEQELTGDAAPAEMRGEVEAAGTARCVPPLALAARANRPDAATHDELLADGHARG